MSLGSIVLKLRLKYQHGLKVAHWRDTMRPKILDTKPVTGNNDTSCEIHVLTSDGDWINLVWMLKTFYHFSKRHYALCIHEDGSLDDATIETLQKHFPDSTIITRKQSDGAVGEILEKYPLCQKFRREHNLSLKLYDFSHYSKSERFLLVDSDVLFFKEPTELLRRIEDPNYKKNTVNKDLKTAYSLEPDKLAEHSGLKIEQRFNSGLGLIHRESLNWEWMEEFLSIPEFRSGHPWRVEQTIYALCSFRWGMEFLPEEYAVHLGPTATNLPSRHYVGEIRHLMYSEGMQQLVKAGFLNQ